MNDRLVKVNKCYTKKREIQLRKNKICQYKVIHEKDDRYQVYYKVAIAQQK